MTAKNLLHSVTVRPRRSSAGRPSFQRLGGLWLVALCLCLSAGSAKAAETVVANYSGNSLTIVNLTTGDRTLLVTTNEAGVNLLSWPVGVAREADGSLLVGEYNGPDQRLFRINPATGLMTILSGAGVGTGDPFGSIAGVAVEATGQILVACEGVNTILRVDPVSGDRTALASAAVGSGATMRSPFTILLGADGTALFTSRSASEILRLDTETGVRSVVSSSSVGDGPLLASPTMVLKLPNGDYATLNESGTDYVLRIDPITGNRTLITGTTRGDGPAIGTRYGMAVADDGNLYVADFSNNSIVRVDVATGDRTIVSATDVGDGPAFNSPLGMLGGAVSSIVPTEGETDLAGNELAGVPYTSGETYFYDPNDAPTDITLSNSSVNQSGGENATVGGLTSTDADEADTHTYTLVAGEGDTDNALFNISESSLRANNPGVLSAGNYSVRVQTDDGRDGTFAKTFAVTVVDDVAPLVTSVSVPANATYRAGDALSFTVNFNEAVTVTGAPVLGITIGEEAVLAAYETGDGTTALTFGYTVHSGDEDTDGVEVGTLGLAGASIRDAADNDVNTTLNNVGDTAGVLVDAAAPYVVSITRKNPVEQVTDATTVVFEVVFSEAVTGVTASMFAVTAVNDGTVTGTVTGVSGGPVAYDVTINLTGGIGEFRLYMAAQ